MRMQTFTACILTCAAMTPAAFAQGNQPAQTQNNPPAAAAQNQDGIQFIQNLQRQQFRSSDLVGQAVYNQQNENIGDVGDVLLDRNGRALGVVIDVGGFLGMGVNEVAVPFSALRFEPADAAMAATGPASNVGATGRSAAGEANSGTATTSPSTAPQSAAPRTGAQGADAAANQQDAGADSDSTLNARIVLNTNREDLESAPKFDDTTNE